MNEPIDAVITWVDGHCPAHQAKLEQYLADKGMIRPEAAAATRFNACGELDYCVQSVFRFAPWIRNVVIVTDGQIPSILETLAGTPLASRVKLVFHSALFRGFEQHLPTFNSLSIESVLWRIEGLSNAFIYLNDDCMLIRPVVVDDFFRDHRVVLRGEWKTMLDKRYFQALLSKLKPSRHNEHRKLQENTAQLSGLAQHFFHLPHAPMPMKRSTLATFFSSHPALLAQNVAYPLRSPLQFWPIALANYLEMQQKTAVVDNTLESVMVHGACHTLDKIKKRLWRAEKNPKAAFLCVQSLDAASPLSQAWMLGWLRQRILA